MVPDLTYSRWVESTDNAAAPVAALLAPAPCKIMGILNVTPDSFSDGGRWIDAQAAVAHATEMIEDGADIIDVGGESTRPGAQRVPVDEELRRVIPVVRRLAENGVPVSIDTMRSAVAAAAVEAGAAIINDVSGGLADDRMLSQVADLGVPYILSHWRAHSPHMDRHDRYQDVVSEVVGELRGRIEAYVDAGADTGLLAIDPGLGFAKQGASNWPLLTHLKQLRDMGFPVLVGASRKRFLAQVIPGGAARPPADRDLATAVVSALATIGGAWCVRVHDVASTADAVAIGEQWRAASPAGASENEGVNRWAT
ncbi:dihydropteroate synthase [Rarobacter incanus]|uniref:Dihydropteroate synthase n=1 Tax=Rarobacter incanus TaxID=153494 RepID=A0A542SP26_9MICO|nr:dihydropteroate synthase [Rarobacter incanus]